MNKYNSIYEIEKKLNGGTLRKDQLFEIAERLLRLDIQKQVNDTDLRSLQWSLSLKLEEYGSSGIIDNQMRYAIKLATYPGKLSYEEMHKLFTLCDVIYALEKLSLKFDISLKILFEKTVKDVLNKEKNMAMLVAQDKIEDWKSQFWWYKIIS